MIKVKDVLSEEEISALPSWVKADIENAVLLKEVISVLKYRMGEDFV